MQRDCKIDGYTIDSDNRVYSRIPLYPSIIAYPILALARYTVTYKVTVYFFDYFETARSDYVKAARHVVTM